MHKHNLGGYVLGTDLSNETLHKALEELFPKRRQELRALGTNPAGPMAPLHPDSQHCCIRSPPHHTEQDFFHVPELFWRQTFQKGTYVPNSCWRTWGLKSFNLWNCLLAPAGQWLYIHRAVLYLFPSSVKSLLLTLFKYMSTSRARPAFLF